MGSEGCLGFGATVPSGCFHCVGPNTFLCAIVCAVVCLWLVLGGFLVAGQSRIRLFVVSYTAAWSESLVWKTHRPYVSVNKY